MNYILSKLFPPKLEPEVMKAYLQRLPNRITVSWFRENGFIIGAIKTGDDEEFYTQAKSPKEFVKMVNDALYVAFDFKPEYIEALHAKDIYSPPPLAWKDLNNGKIPNASFVPNASFGFEKQIATS